MDDYDYNEDDIYGGSSEDLSGLTISGGIDGSLESNDPAAMWLSQQEQSAIDSGDGASFQEELIGSATAADLQLGRISHVEPRIQAGIKAVLSGQSLGGVHPVDLAAAREEFGSVIGSDPTKFARQIKFDESVQLPRHEQDIKTVMSMIGNTAGNFLDRGPGGQLVNTYATDERREKADADLVQALGYVQDLAGLYIDGRTVGSPVEGARRRALEESITNRLTEGVFYEGSSNTLPLPNETGVTGIVATQGIYGTPQGTSEDRLSSGQFDDLYKQVSAEGGKTRFARDDQGFKVFRDDVTGEQRSDALRRTPSLANSLFPKPRSVGKQSFTTEEKAKHARDQKFAMGQAQYKADFARRVLREQMPTTRDESKGQIRMSGWDTPYGEQADLQNLRNEAAIQGIDWNSKFSGQKEDDIQSELTAYIENVTESPSTSGEIKQGTQAWLNQRKGKITASTAAGLLKAGGVEERAMELAMERLGTSTPFTGNAHTREGNEGEARAARAFMSGPGKSLTMYEAYFEEDENIPGFGVSPDGRLYDQEGASAGLLELKYLSSGSMSGALSKYTPQMQMQMAITGESQTHFYALDKYTGEYVHEVVKANPNMQAELIEAGQSALSMAAGLDNRGVQALRKQIESNKPRQRKGASEKATGQTTSFEVDTDIDEPMTAFQAAVMTSASSGISGEGAGSTALAKKLTQIDQAERMKEAVADAQDADPTADIAGQQVQARKRGLLEVAAYAEKDKRENAQQEAANQELADAAKEASSSVKNFGKSVKDASLVLGELGGLITGGNASGMSEVRLAAETGQDVGQVRGTREALA